VEALFASFTEAVRAFWSVFGNPDLRRVELAFVCFNAAELGTRIAVLVFAHEAGGTAAAGAIGVVQLIPATIFAPVASLLGDRLPAREGVAGRVPDRGPRYGPERCRSLSGSAQLRGLRPGRADGDHGDVDQTGAALATLLVARRLTPAMMAGAV